MLSKNKYDEGYCYLQNDFREDLLFNISQNTYEIFTSADKIKFANDINKNFSKGELDWDKHLNLEKSFIGSIKIISAIENYFKLILLKNNYIIHDIIKEKAEILFNRQKKEPISLQQILDFENILQPIPNDATFITLTNKTISITKILNSPKYLNLMSLSNANIKFIKQINDERNFLHYVTKTAGVISNESNLHYIELKENIVNELIKLNTFYGQKMKISEKAFLKNRL